MLGRWIRWRVENWYRTGAALDEAGLKYVRRMRWLAVPSGVLFIVIGVSDDRWTGKILWYGLSAGILLIALPAAIVMLRGHERREHIDTTHGLERLDAARLGAGTAAGVALVPLVERLEESWPWW